MTKAEILKELTDRRNSEFILSKREDFSDYLYHRGLYIAYTNAVELIEKLEETHSCALRTIIHKLNEIVEKEEE